MKKSKATNTAAANGLYAPFRELGLVCDDVKFLHVNKGGVGYIICSVGHTFHIYSLEKLELVFVGPTFDGTISALAALNDMTFVAIRGKIHVVERNVEVAQIEIKNGLVSSMMVLGEFLIAAGGSSIHVFDAKSYSTLRECLDTSC